MNEDSNQPIDAPITELAPPVRKASPAPPPELHTDDEPTADEIEELRSELDRYRKKAIQLDVLVFEMRALLQSGKGFSQILNIKDLLEAFMAVCRERYGAVNSTVFLLDDLDPLITFYRVRACWGLEPTYVGPDGEREEMLLFKIPHDQGLLWQLIHQGDVFSVRDMQRLPRFKTAFKRWTLELLKSDVWVPLVRGGKVLGVLTLGERDDGTQIPEHEYAFLQEIAAVAATNIDSTLKYEKNERILSNLQTLYNVNQQLANVNDFKKLSIDTLSSAVTALRAQKANLMLFNPETQLLEIKVVWGNIPRNVRDDINEGRTKTKTFQMGEGVAGKAAESRLPVRINDRTQIEQVGRNLVYCILSAPLLMGDEVVGVMTLTNKVQTVGGKLELDPLGRFGEDDAHLLRGLADQAAVNLHKARLYSASITDRLTGLYNTRHFESSLEAAIELSRQTGAPVSLAVTDIDHFKRFNDTHGHKAGDAVLMRTARQLGEMVRDGGVDMAFRYGGEEFCMLLPATDGPTAARILESYRRKVEQTQLEYEGKTLQVKVSVGIATFPTNADSRKALFEAADKALYFSKQNGRNTVTRVEAGAHVRVTPPEPPPAPAPPPETPAE